MKTKKTNFLIFSLILTILLSSCSSSENTWTNVVLNDDSNIETNVKTNTNDSTEEIVTTQIQETEEAEEINIEEKELELKTSNNAIEEITLNWDSITYLWDNAFISWTKLTITKAGNYKITWTLNDGQIVVETDDENAVKLILAWVNISNSSTSPIYVSNAKQTIIYLEDWTTNTLEDANDYFFDNEDEEPNATIFSKDDLVIMWNWSLEVTANYNDAIASKDDLYIENGNITINSVDDWIRWKDYLQIDGWNISITSDWDSLKADNEDEGQIFINWWDIEISSWDDWVHAEVALTINWWNINITKSYEWLESKVITINWWNIDVISSDDWLNVAWWNDSSWMGWRWWMDFWGDMSSNTSSYIMYINWWIINVNANWDWLDANGSIVMTWWEVYVNWPTSSWNWPLDYDSSFTISWWILVAAWSSWMAQNISSTSSQYWILFWFDSSVSAWTVFSLKDSSENIIIEFTPEKTYQSIVISTQELQNWETYSYYLDWENQGNFTISSITTTVWTIWRWWMMWWWGRWDFTWDRPIRPTMTWDFDWMSPPDFEN